MVCRGFLHSPVEYMAHFQALGRCVNDLQWESNAHNGIWFSTRREKVHQCGKDEDDECLWKMFSSFDSRNSPLSHLFFMSVLCLFCLFHFLISVSLYFFPLFSWSDSGFGSSFLPKEESATTAPEVVVRKDYQASSQVSRLLFLLSPVSTWIWKSFELWN